MRTTMGACGVVMLIAAAACGPIEQSSVSDGTKTPTVRATSSPRATATPEADDTSTPVEVDATVAPRASPPTTTFTPAPLVTSPQTEAPDGSPTIPARNRPLQFSPGPYLTASDLDARGSGPFEEQVFLGDRLTIASIGVDAPIDVVVADQGTILAFVEFVSVAGYEFRDYPGHGGVPGFGNMVIGGQYRYFDDTLTPGPPAVFFRLHEIAVGDEIRLATSDGRTFAYRVEFNKLAQTPADGGTWTWSTLIEHMSRTTEHESITIFSGDESGAIRVVWGRAYP